MSELASAPDHSLPRATTPAHLGTALTFLLALGAGLAAATLYYTQPILGVLAHDLGASERAIGWVPTATQLGYALGILLLAPLGDRYDRRRIIVTKAALLTVTLLAAGTVDDVRWLVAASLAIGMTASLAQDIVPAAAALAADAQRGRVVGAVMTGLLLGILVSRVVSGFVAEQLGWRAVFVGAAVSIAAVGVALARGLPRIAPTTQLAYGTLLRSLGTLVARHGELRRAALAQGLLSSAFSAFWSTLAVMLHGAPFRLGSTAAGAFGLAGAAGALIAPVAGRLADQRGPGLVTRLGAGVAALSFGVMALAPLLPLGGQLVLLVVATIGFDLGVQASLISHQMIVYGLEPAARSRLNAVLLVTMFVAMAIGAAIGSQLLAAWGWPAVVAYAAATSVAALGVRLWPRRPVRS